MANRNGLYVTCREPGCSAETQHKSSLCPLHRGYTRFAKRYVPKTVLKRTYKPGDSVTWFKSIGIQTRQISATVLENSKIGQTVKIEHLNDEGTSVTKWVQEEALQRAKPAES